MSSIGGPGGIGGPKGPSGPSGPSGPDEAGDAGEVGDAAHVHDASGNAAIDGARAARAVGELEAMATEIAAGKLTAREAVDKLVNDIASHDQLGAGERAELHELLTDLVTNDPYLSSLVGRA